MGKNHSKPAPKEDDLDEEQIEALMRDTAVEVPLRAASQPSPPPKPAPKEEMQTSTQWKRNPAFEQFLLEHMPVTDPQEVERKSLWEWEHLCIQSGVIIPEAIRKTLSKDEAEPKEEKTATPPPPPPPQPTQRPSQPQQARPPQPQPQRQHALPAPTRTYPSQSPQQRTTPSQPFPVYINTARNAPPPPPPPPPPLSAPSSYVPTTPSYIPPTESNKTLTRYKESVETLMEYERQLARKWEMQQRIESGALPNNWTKSDIDAWTELRERTRQQHATVQAHYSRQLQNMQLDLQQRLNWLRDTQSALDPDYLAHHQKRCAVLQSDIDRLSKAISVKRAEPDMDRLNGNGRLYGTEF